MANPLGRKAYVVVDSVIIRAVELKGARDRIELAALHADLVRDTGKGRIIRKTGRLEAAFAGLAVRGGLAMRQAGLVRSSRTLGTGEAIAVAIVQAQRAAAPRPCRDRAGFPSAG